MSLPTPLAAVFRPFGRPWIGDRVVGAWVALLASVYVGLENYASNEGIGLFTWDPSGLMGVNYHVYHVAAEAALAGEHIYTVHPPGQSAGYTYLYPPISVVTWIPFTALDWETGLIVFTAITVLGCALATGLLVRYVERFDRQLGWVDVALLFGLFVCSSHAFGSVYFGNVTLLLGVLFVIGFVALAHQRDTVAGIAFAVAALFKVFPAVVGLWLLRDRRWRATGVALATGVGGLLAGAIAFGPGTTLYYFRDVLLARGGPADFVGGYPADGFLYVTIQRPLSNAIWYVWPAAPSGVLPVVTAVFVAILLFVFYVDVEDRLDRLFAIMATTVVTVIALPALQWYLVLVFLPLVTLAYVLPRSPGRYVFLAGVAVLAVGKRPSKQITWLADLPEPLFGVWAAVAGSVTFETVGLLLALLGCGIYKVRTVEDRSRYDPRVQWRALWAWCRDAVTVLRRAVPAAR